MGPSLTPTMNTVIENYNQIAILKNWEPVNTLVSSAINITCVVKDFMDSTYGKFALGNEMNQIIMEY
jgi:hypothetical protein